ncbi:MAG: MFS transporter [Acidimicrobiia bacterium]|nr:MFS transporter [Acidimicrobiia bacterium]
MSRVVVHHTVDDAALQRLLAPRDAIIVEEPARVGDRTFDAALGPVRSYRRTLHVDATLADGRHHVVDEIRFSLAIPFFALLFVLPVRSALTQASKDAAAGHTVERQPWWAPPDRFDRRAATVLAMLGALSIVGGYLGTLITQTITFAADRFDADDSAQGLTLALVRIGVVLALFIVAASDRRGRRLLLLGTATAAILVAATGALAPSLFWLGSSQTVARGLSTALALLVGIVAAEELPAGSRAYGVSVMALAGGLGAGMCVWVLPLADLGPDAWRILYLVPLAALPIVLRVSRLLPESRRFVVHRGHAPIGVDRSRLGLLAVSGFLASVFLAPASQFQNEFLRTERGFSASRISAFTLLTTTPAGIGVAVGGRLADVRGRRRVAAVGLLGGAGFTVAAYVTSGWPMWSLSGLGSIIAAATVPALGVYGPELFPTTGRGRANGIITLIGVVGSSVGLLAAGYLSERLGGLGPAMAILAIGPVLLAVLILTRYPETAHRELEDLNPGDRDPAGLAEPAGGTLNGDAPTGPKP